MDEIVPDNTDFITSNLISTSNQDIDFIGLTSVADPLQSDGHVIRVVAREEGLGVNAPFILAYLSQGQSFDIALLNITQGTLTTTFTEYNYTLTNAEADSITDYSTLELRLEASCNTGTCNAGGSRDRVSISWMELAILDDPPVPPATLDSVLVLNSTALQISFTEPVDTTLVLSYNIERDDGSGFNVVGNVPVGTTTFDNIRLIPDTFYSYRIISVGASSNSIASNVISQRTTVILFSSSPDSNIGARWVNGLGNPPCSDTATFECINEEMRDDGDFIQTIGLGSSNSDIDSFTMSDMEDPLRSDSHFLKYTLRRAGVGDNPVEFEIVLRQGVTTIVTFTHSSLTPTYVFHQQELTPAQANSITDYNDLEIEITGSCDSSCSNGQREKVNVSFIVFEIEQVSSPAIDNIATLSSSSLRISWVDAFVDPELIDIIVQRKNVTDFMNIANVTTSTFTFDDTGLESNKIIKYRLVGMLPSGFSKPSPEFTGATNPSTAEMNGNGTIVEPNANNSFSLLEKQILSNTIQHYNITTTELGQIFTDIDTNQLNMYEIIVKMNDGSYSSSQEMRNAGAFYGTEYLIFLNIDDFIGNVTDDVRLALGGSNGTGNNPQFAKEKPVT